MCGGLGGGLPSQDIRSCLVKGRDTLPKKLNPTFQPTGGCSSSSLLKTGLPPFRRLCSRQLAPPGEEPPFAGRRQRPPIWWSWPMRIQARQERVGFAPAGSDGSGGRGMSSCYTFCESRAHGRKGKQSRPTHSRLCTSH